MEWNKPATWPWPYYWNHAGIALVWTVVLGSLLLWAGVPPLIAYGLGALSPSHVYVGREIGQWDRGQAWALVYEGAGWAIGGAVAGVIVSLVLVWAIA